MFEFIFDDSELDALNNLIRMCSQQNLDSLPDWIYLEHDVAQPEEECNLILPTAEHPSASYKGTQE